MGGGVGRGGGEEETNYLLLSLAYFSLPDPPLFP